MNTTSWTPPVSTTPEEYAYNMAAFGTTSVRFPAKTGVELIAEERQRQIEKEGWTPEHDDSHESGEMALAASCYAYFAGHTPSLEKNCARSLGPPPWWPWERKWWKPHGTVHDLVRAGALIAAEIDRLQRIKQP